jgi:predicted enzyme related to lactoylglutathione lyase
MTSVVRNIAIDCTDPYQLATFWSQVVGRPIYHEDRPGDEEVGIDLPTGQTLFFQRVPEDKAGKNRVHVCLQPDGPRDGEVQRLLEIGAAMVEDHRRPDGAGWAVLADPEGNEFCVLRSMAERGF